MSTVKKSTADCAKNNTYNDDIKLDAQEGQLSNPGYPEYFTDNIQCTWFIRVARRHSIELEFEFFDMRPHLSCSRKPETGYIEIHDGYDWDSKSLGVFCGRRKPEKTASSDNEMLVRFKTNGYGSTKFKANYRAIKGKARRKQPYRNVINSETLKRQAVGYMHTKNVGAQYVLRV